MYHTIMYKKTRYTPKAIHPKQNSKAELYRVEN